MNFNVTDYTILVSLFLLSIAYAFLLQYWKNNYPESFDDLTWLQVVIGVGYILLALAVVLDLCAWLRISAAFFVSSIPIISRSIINFSKRRREANGRLEGGKYE